MILRDKIRRSTELLKKAARLAESYSGKPIYLAFSGGKDSQVCYHLLKEADIPFEAHYNATTIDPPELVRFIRLNYPDTIFTTPKISFWDLCEQKGMLPTMFARFCCAVLKEAHGGGRVVVTGVRREESARRSKRAELVLQKGRTFKEQNIDEFTREQETQAECHQGQGERVTINPILEWTTEDVWKYLNNVVKVPHCSVYDKGRTRVGCLFCPLKGTKEIIRDAKEYPHQFRRLQKVIKHISEMEGEKFKGDPQGFFEWWVSKKNIKDFLSEREARLFPIEEVTAIIKNISNQD